MAWLKTNQVGKNNNIILIVAKLGGEDRINIVLQGLFENFSTYYLFC